MKLIKFPGHIKPAYPGVYKRTGVIFTLQDRDYFSFWNGTFWCEGSYYVNKAAIINRVKSVNQSVPWAGIELTDWFAAFDFPKRNGVYQVRSKGKVAFSLWEDLYWHTPEATPEKAAKAQCVTAKFYTWKGMQWN